MKEVGKKWAESGMELLTDSSVEGGHLIYLFDRYFFYPLPSLFRNRELLPTFFLFPSHFTSFTTSQVVRT